MSQSSIFHDFEQITQVIKISQEGQQPFRQTKIV